MIFLFNWVIFRLHVSFQGCNICNQHFHPMFLKSAQLVEHSTRLSVQIAINAAFADVSKESGGSVVAFLHFLEISTDTGSIEEKNRTEKIKRVE